MPPEMDRTEFDELVAEALDQIPPELADGVENCVIMVEDAPPSDEPNLLGLYQGIPLTERGESYAGALPDRITIFRLPILARCQDRAEVVQQIRITVVHEIAHFFGIDDQRLDELGYA